jgi:hypothetical protein
MSDLWNYTFDWELNTGGTSGYTWEKVNRLDQYVDDDRTEYLEDVYFKYQKCISGITYQYCLDILDVYKRGIMVGDYYYTYLMYNENDIINEFMDNFTYVDIYSVDNVDLTKKYVTLNNKPLKSSHRIILLGQTDSTENGIYTFDINGSMVRATDLDTTGQTFRYGVNVRLDNNQNVEFFLMNSGMTNHFPTTYEEKTFTSGHTFIIKNIFSYNINETGSTSDVIPRLWFTDYEFARVLNKYNASLYNSIGSVSMPTASIVIMYNSGYTTFDIGASFVDYKGGFNYHNDSGKTYLDAGATFASNSDVNDYLQIIMSGNTYLVDASGVTGSTEKYADFYSIIKDISGGYIILNEYIPDDVLSGMTYLDILNMNKLSSGDWDKSIDILNNHYYAKFYTFHQGSSQLVVSATTSNYDYYFDYDGIYFYFDGSQKNFQSDNRYIDYILYDHLNIIDSSTFDSSFDFGSGYTMTSFTTAYTYLIDDPSYPQTIVDLDSPFKVTPTTASDMDYFYNHTEVHVNTDYRSYIIDMGDDYFIIEKPTGLTSSITSISTDYSLTGISSALYDVYKNIDIYESGKYYNEKDDGERKNICSAYNDIISNNEYIMKYTTGTITPNEDNKYILKLYNYRNSGNTELSGNTMEYTDWYYDNDPNLRLYPADLLDVGIDKQTKMPIPIETSNLLISDTIASGHTLSLLLDYTKQPIKLVNGMTLEKLKVKYGWIFNAKVKDAIIGENEYGLVWYKGEWLCGEWVDGTWYNGIFHDGIWKNGRWYSYLVDYKQLLINDRFKILDENKIYSNFRNGVWRNGDFYNGIFGDDISITGYTSKVFLDHTSILPDNLYVATWKYGRFHKGEFKNSIWENGIFFYGDMYDGYWKDGTFYTGTFKGNWWKGNFLGGDFISGIWESGLFTTSSNVKARFGYNDYTCSATTTEWWDGTMNAAEVYAGITEPINYNRTHIYFGTIKNSKFYAGHIFACLFYRSWFYNGVFGTWDSDILLSGSTVFQEGQFMNGIWLDGTFLSGNFRNGIWMKGTFTDGELSANNPVTIAKLADPSKLTKTVTQQVRRDVL